MRLSIAVAAVLSGLQAVSALRLSPRNIADREEEVSRLFNCLQSVKFRLEGAIAVFSSL